MRPYWSCQIAGWTVYGLLAATIPFLYGGPRWPILARAVLGSFLGLVLSDLLRRRMTRGGWLRLPAHQLVSRLAAGSLTIGALMVAALSPLLFLIIPESSRPGAITAIFGYHVALMLVWSAIYLIVHNLRDARSAEAERWRLELLVRETELRALRAQLNPHFLFNSLNSVRGLVTEDPGKAREAITGLAALLRYTLQLSRARTTTLRRELEVVRYYLQLEALRFEARLQYCIDAEPEALERPIPPMLVQTLVENAIKHGISHLPEGGAVRVQARTAAGDLHIEVTNTGDAVTTDLDRGGIGLATSLEQLRLIFGDRVTLDLQTSGPGEVSCHVLVPAPPSDPVAADASRSEPAGSP